MRLMARHTGTRERVLETAATLLQRQGYTATGLNQVLAESNAPKGSLYFHFPGGKEQLAAEAITISGPRLGEQMAGIVLAAEGPGQALAGLADLFATGLETSGFRGGCPVATVALEAAADSEAIRSSCDSVYGSWAAGLSLVMRRWGVTEADALPLSELVISALQGAILLARVRQDTTVIHTVAGLLAAQVSQALQATEKPGQ
jgi:TetR/AcrR family transcriptional repressor of lmrAB and yxaGH operons